jgi:hypothetical protein
MENQTTAQPAREPYRCDLCNATSETGTGWEKFNGGEICPAHE